MTDSGADHARPGAREPPRRLLSGRSRASRPRPAAVLGRPRHQRHGEVDPGALRGRDRDADGGPRPARRGLRRRRRQGSRPRRRRGRRRRCPRGVRERLRPARDQGERPLRAGLSALHRAGAPADREARRPRGARARLRHDRPRLHGQGQRPGAARWHGRGPGPRAEDPRPGARVADGARRGARLRARAGHPAEGRVGGLAVLDRRQPLGPLLGGQRDRGHRRTPAGRRLPARHPAREGARRPAAPARGLRRRATSLARRGEARPGRAGRARRPRSEPGTASGSSTTSRTGSSASRSATSTRSPQPRS